jgi:Ammonium Transporter Family.
VDAALKIVDTCGVHNLHGMPGLLGGLAAAVLVPGIAKAQLIGIACTVLLAFVSGSVSGYVIALAGTKAAAYQDGDEFQGAASADSDDDDDQPLVAEPSPGM